MPTAPCKSSCVAACQEPSAAPPAPKRCKTPQNKPDPKEKELPKLPPLRFVRSEPKLAENNAASQPEKPAEEMQNVTQAETPARDSSGGDSAQCTVNAVQVRRVLMVLSRSGHKSWTKCFHRCPNGFQAPCISCRDGTGSLRRSFDHQVS